RSRDVEPDANVLEPHGHLARDAERAAQVEVAFDGDRDAVGRDPERRRDELAGDLGAGGEGAEQQVAGARSRSRTAGASVRLGRVGRAPDVDRAGERRRGLAPVGAQRDARARRVAPVPLLERPLQRLQIHEGLLGRKDSVAHAARERRVGVSGRVERGPGSPRKGSRERTRYRAFLKTFPSFMTKTTFSRTETSWSGSPLTAIRSARLPGSREPASLSRPIRSEAPTVAERIASIGVCPYFTCHANWRVFRPWGYTLASVPKAILTPA